MKKSIVLLSLLTAISSFAGETGAVTIAEPTILPPVERQKNCITLQAGIMHSSGAYEETVAERLYGLTLSAERQIAVSANNKYIQTVGCSLGFYTGDEHGDFLHNDFFMITDLDENVLTWNGEKSNFTIDSTVYVIPIMATYNIMYEATESLYFYAGVRGGVVIRNTDVSGKGHIEYQEDNYAPINADVTCDDSCTKVVPTLGIGIGMRAYMTERWAFDLSYDFTWTFGDDCDDFHYSNGSVLEGTTESSRYYGTLKAGVSYSF
ncbi:MAG: hypothetical protein Q4F40_07900 [Akkermansia sp.]|nr:hypothetical protein [Akkermansia sp.]